MAPMSTAMRASFSVSLQLSAIQLRRADSTPFRSSKQYTAAAVSPAMRE